MVERPDIDEMLDALLFDEADDLVENHDLGPELAERVARRRAEAEERARALYERIGRLRDEEDHVELARIARDPVTQPLFSLLGNSSRRRVEQILEAAERWAAYQKKTNARRLEQSRQALESFDLELARGLMNKIDGRFLTEEQGEERDQLLLEISGRAMELESFAETERRLLGEADSRSDDQPWWRRWLG